MLSILEGQPGNTPHSPAYCFLLQRKAQPVLPTASILLCKSWKFPSGNLVAEEVVVCPACFVPPAQTAAQVDREAGFLPTAGKHYAQ